jgi:hypothetical protein
MCVGVQRDMANVRRVVWPPQRPQGGKINILNEKASKFKNLDYKKFI